ncbi:flagellar hook-length control protein FliK [Paenibacillus tarimensis]|uniref:flagellar hook-length control protein FliK n=1 Tax=Paenibacillus tarimensis TaxID=416012 RepID=UPI001F41DACC|nr:flagellar hook-length control protein FliK [Paenibacillus tarimensis]MCF2942308.1 flagellar hook-length control protein FliK [Paenibacillus tarimensis]
MEMMIGQMSAVPVQQTAKTGVTEAGKGFANMLVQSVGKPAGTSASGSAAEGMAAAVTAVNGGFAGIMSGTAEEKLSAELDELLALLDEGAAAEIDAGQLEKLQEQLAELNELLSALFPLSSVVIPVQLTEETPALTISALKALVEEGQLKTLTKEQLTTISSKLEQIKQLADGTLNADATGTQVDNDDLAMKNSGLDLKNNEQLIVKTAKSITPADNMLGRLGQQPVPITVLSAVVQDAGDSAALSGVDSLASLDQTASPTSVTTTGSAVQETVKTAGTEQAKQPAAEQVPVQRFAETVSGTFVKQFGLLKGNAVSEARLTLLPEHLGQVDVKITMQNGQLTAQFVTDNVMARDMIESQMVQLRASLQTQGLQVEKLEVTHNPVQGQTFQNPEQRGGNGQAFQQKSKQGGLHDDSAPSFEGELVEQVVINGLGYGRSINVKA